MKRARSNRDRERKDRIKVDLDEIRRLLPKCATDKKMVTTDCSLTLRIWKLISSFRTHYENV